MRVFRTVAAALTALVVGLGLVAGQAVSASAALPERDISIKIGRLVDYNTFKLKGKVQDYKRDKVIVQRKKCRNCHWRKYKVDETNRRGRYVVRARRPDHGKWRYRAKVKASDGYATSYSRAVAVRVS